MKLNKLLLASLILLSTAALAQMRPTNPALDSLLAENNVAVLNQRLLKLERGSEKDLRLLLSYYNRKKNPAKAEAILATGVQRYPLGEMALIQATNKLYSTRAAKVAEELLSGIKSKFPKTTNLDGGNYHVASLYAESKNVEKVTEYLNMIKSPAYKSSSVRICAQLVNNYDPTAAEKIAKEEIAKLLKGGTPAQKTSATPGTPEADSHYNYFAFMNLYSSILTKQGKFEEALPYAKQAYESSLSSKGEYTERYAVLLARTKRYAEALPLLETLITTGKASQEAKKAFELAYEAENKGKSASTYFAELQAKLSVEIKAKVAKLMLEEKSPGFSVTDVNGKVVSLQDFKGKTIVLDFWATWCGPCKKSFPAMQKVVNKYKDDDKVKLLFIHTWEQNPRPLEDAMEYLSSNNYKFDLYMDVKDPITKVSPAISAFGASGIPAKYIIDGKVMLRFKVTGFEGGDDAAVMELSAMIDIAKTAS